MPSSQRRACWARVFTACAIASLILLVALLLCFVTKILLNWQDVDAKDQTFSYEVPRDCRSQPTVVTGDATVQVLNTSAISSQTWSRAQKRAREPAHSYMKRRHAVALYAYTDLLRSGQRRPVAAGGKRRKRTRQRFESRSFFNDLGEAIRILKHSGVTCLHTALPAEALHNLNVSSELLRFRTFTMGYSGKHISRNSLCVLVRTCFGADVSRYSASRRRGQVLIPPYEVFRVASGPGNWHRCRAVRRLEGHMDCVYDADSDSLHSISANPPDAFWLLFIVLCMISAPLALPILVVKLLICHKRSCCGQLVGGPSSAERPLGGLNEGSNPPQ